MSNHTLIEEPSELWKVSVCLVPTYPKVLL